MRPRLLWLPLWLAACVPTPPSGAAGPTQPTGSVLPSDGQSGPGNGSPERTPEGAGEPLPPGEGAGSTTQGGGTPAQPCGDGVCDGPEQENPSLCPRDCQEKPANGDDWCGDGICDAKESLDASCPVDCADQAPSGAPGPGTEPPPGAPPPAEPPPEAPPEGDAPDGPPPEGAPTVPPAETGTEEGEQAMPPPAP